MSREKDVPQNEIDLAEQLMALQVQCGTELTNKLDHQRQEAIVLVNHYKRSINLLASERGSEAELVSLLEETEDSATDYLAATSTTITTLLAAHGLRYERLIPAEVQDLWSQLLVTAEEEGVESSATRALLYSHPSQAVRAVLIAALDAEVSKQLFIRAKEYGVNSEQTLHALAAASSQSVRNALFVALKHLTLLEALDRTEREGVASAAVAQTLTHVSMPHDDPFNMVVRIGLDRSVWTSVLRHEQESDRTSAYGLEQIITQGSWEVTWQFMKNLIDRRQIRSPLGETAVRRSDSDLSQPVPPGVADLSKYRQRRNQSKQPPTA